MTYLIFDLIMLMLMLYYYIYLRDKYTHGQVGVCKQSHELEGRRVRHNACLLRDAYLKLECYP